MKGLTPKDKAKELIDKFWNVELAYYECKQCALIAVDLLLEEIFFESEPTYWQEVKSEIEKL